MATVRFNLRSADIDKPQPIYLIFRHRNLKVKYSTGLKCSPPHWNKHTQRVRNTTSEPNKDRINNLLNDLQAEAIRWASEVLAARLPIVGEDFRQHLDEYTGRVKAEGKTFLQFVAAFIEEAPNRNLPTTGRPPARNTIQKFERCFALLQEFVKETGFALDFDTVNLDFYNDFTSFLQDKDYSRNYVGKQIANVKTFMGEATRRGLNTNLTYQSRYFRKLQEESDSIYLTVEELEAIQRLDLADNPRLDRVRDLFLVGAWTGLRFSDFTTISREHIQGDLIHIEQFKTAEKVVIPIHSVVRAILDKYDGDLPAAISNQKMNNYIKEVSQLAGITTPIIKGGTRGGKRISERFKKWELVTTHTARRSFATNAYQSGIPAISIMKITGHRTESAFLKYIKLSKEEHARIVARQWAQVGSALKPV
ncbi:MAG: site-specific integrase [Bacteroidota bacterium]